MSFNMAVNALPSNRYSGNCCHLISCVSLRTIPGACLIRFTANSLGDPSEPTDQIKSMSMSHIKNNNKLALQIDNNNMCRKGKKQTLM